MASTNLVAIDSSFAADKDNAPTAIVKIDDTQRGIQNQKDFEKELRSISVASHRLYSELGTQDKLIVYKTYIDTNKMSATKNKLVMLYLETQ
ncbi:MAG: hypothetical protein IME93_06945 [Proteobacteria bacterium]|nr:hypothetical protein [Pseudomonadota bacterium]